jgi:hypothetical protein
VTSRWRRVFQQVSSLPSSVLIGNINMLLAFFSFSIGFDEVAVVVSIIKTMFISC